MLILIHGEDTYSSWKKLKGYSSQSEKFDFSDFDFSLFKEKVTASPLFGTPMPVIVKGILSDKSKKYQKEIVSFLKETEPFTDVVFYEDKTIKAGDIFKLVKEKGELIVFSKLNRREIKTWVNKELSVDNYTVDTKVVEMLVSWVGEDLWLLSSEIEKLRLSQIDTKNITTDDVSVLSSVQVSGNIFELVDNLGYRNKKQTLSILTQILRSGGSVHFVWAMIIRQFRLLIQIVDLVEARKSKDEIIKEMKLAPFIAGKIISQARKFTKQELEVIYTRLLAIDTGIKLGDDLQLQIEMLLEDICY